MIDMDTISSKNKKKKQGTVTPITPSVLQEKSQYFMLSHKTSDTKGWSFRSAAELLPELFKSKMRLDEKIFDYAAPLDHSSPTQRDISWVDKYHITEYNFITPEHDDHSLGHLIHLWNRRESNTTERDEWEISINPFKRYKKQDNGPFLFLFNILNIHKHRGQTCNTNGYNLFNKGAGLCTSTHPSAMTNAALRSLINCRAFSITDGVVGAAFCSELIFKQLLILLITITFFLPKRFSKTSLSCQLCGDLLSCIL